MMKDFLLAMFNKSRILCQRKVMLWIAAVVLFVVFPSFVIDFLELLGGLVALIFAARVGMLDDEGKRSKKGYFSDSGYGDDNDHNDDADKYQHEVDLGFH